MVIQFLDQGGMAGHTISVDALNSTIYNGKPTDATYLWNFGDPSGTYNTLPGWNAAHRYDHPGTYTVSLTITDAAGKTSTAVGTVNIAADTRRVIYVDNNGSDSNSGASPSTPIKTLAHAASMLGDNTEVLLRRGQSFDLANTIFVGFHNVLVGAYGQGNSPVVRKIAGQGSICFLTPSNADDVTFQDLTFDSIWGLNSVYGSWKVPADAIALGGKNMSVLRCQFHNVTDAVDCELHPTGVLVQDNYMGPELRGYGIWAEGVDHVYLGNTMTNSRQEHLIRADDGNDGNALTHVLIAYNNLSRPTNTKGSIELRTCTWFYVSDNVIKGGTMRVGLQENPKEQFPNWASWKTGEGVLQNNTTYNVFWNFRPGVWDVNVRNNVIHVDNLYGIEFECIKAGYDQVRKTSDIRITNNTMIDNGTTGQFLWIDGHATNLVLDDNQMIAPNLSLGASGASGAVFVTNADLSSFKEIKDNVWPAAPTGGPQAGLNYIGPMDINPADYLTSDKWNALPNVDNDVFRSVSAVTNGQTVIHNNVVQGARVRAA